jgi:hypothetical protein
LPFSSSHTGLDSCQLLCVILDLLRDGEATSKTYVFGGPNQFLKIYALCTPEWYDFMHCDLQANPPLAYHCFDYVVAEGDKVVFGGGNSVDIPEDVFTSTTKSSDVGDGSSSTK